MARDPRSRSVARLVIAVALAAAGLGSLVAAPAAAAAGLPRWTGGVDLYRSGVFTTQQTWLWCTAADVQIARNIVDHRHDHSRSAQQRYFDYMRRHNRYAIPVADGVDPAGWANGLRQFVDHRYRLVSSGSFKSALRSAVRSLRLTGLPVGITVSHGNHAWLLTGFTATADPAVTTHFSVTSVRVVGPLWGLQSRAYGYDMRPDTRLTRRQLQSFFTPWHYAGVRMAWEGDWVSVQPQPTAADRARAATPTPTTPPPTQSPSPRISPSPAGTSPAVVSTSSAATIAESPSHDGSSDGGPLALVAGAPDGITPSPSPRPVPAAAREPVMLDLDGAVAVLIVVIAAAGGTGILVSRKRGRPHTG
jgi:hypothetical protein